MAAHRHGRLSAIVGFAWAPAIDAAHHTAIGRKQSNVLAALSTSPRPNQPQPRSPQTP